MTRFHAALAATCSMFLSFCCFTVSAQNAGPQLDVVGLKLGMTIQQARDTLTQHEPGMKFVTFYATDDPELISLWGSGGQATIDDARFSKFPIRASKVKAPIGLLAGVLTHAQDANENDISRPDVPLYHAEGEWFRLRFTPSDEGGHLYAIARTVLYRHGLLRRPDLSGPTADALNQQFVAKYGQPSNRTGDYENDWMYDVRGRLLAKTSVDFGRCLSPAGLPQLNFALSGQDASGVKKSFTLKDYNDAFSDTDGFSLDDSRRLQLSMMLSTIEGFVPRLDGYGYAQDRERYRKCGVLLQTFLGGVSGAPDAKGVDYFVTALSDQNALHFDNGIEVYLRRKLMDANGPAPAPAKAKL